MEAAVVLDLEWNPILFHVPTDRTDGSLPDSHSLWETLWTNRKNLLGLAHSHPGGGIPTPSHTDVTTFSAIERNLGVGRLLWPIITVDAVRVYTWQGPGKHDYGEKDMVLTLGLRTPWIVELARLSE